MEQARKKVLEFLNKYGASCQSVDFEANVEMFLSEMEKGLQDQQSSLEMIPTYIEVETDVPINEPVIVIDAGGTNFRVATVVFDENKKAKIENLKIYPMPGIDKEISKDEFFEIMADYVKDVAAVSNKIGFCFSYPSEIFPNKDAKLLRFVKEVKAPQVVGQIIGENFNLAMKSAGLGGDKNIIILNDTVATLLGGVGHKGRRFGGYLGFILGTGTNCCYIEKNSNIKKKKNLDSSKSQIINAESGGFGKIQQSSFDKQLDLASVNPAVHKFEKMISGVYLGPLCLLVAKTAGKDGLFSAETAKKIEQIAELEAKQVNDFLYYPYSDNELAKACGQCDQNTAVMYSLVEGIIERAAKLTAINLTAMAVKSERRTNPAMPICIVAEGTTFYKMKGLKEKVDFYLKQYLQDKRGISYEIISVENATLLGAAIAGLTN